MYTIVGHRKVGAARAQRRLRAKMAVWRSSTRIIHLELEIISDGEVGIVVVPTPIALERTFGRHKFIVLAPLQIDGIVHRMHALHVACVVVCPRSTFLVIKLVFARIDYLHQIGGVGSITAAIDVRIGERCCGIDCRSRNAIDRHAHNRIVHQRYCPFFGGHLWLQTDAGRLQHQCLVFFHHSRIDRFARFCGQEPAPAALRMLYHFEIVRHVAILERVVVGRHSQRRHIDPFTAPDGLGHWHENDRLMHAMVSVEFAMPFALYFKRIDTRFKRCRVRDRRFIFCADNYLFGIVGYIHRIGLQFTRKPTAICECNYAIARVNVITNIIIFYLHIPKAARARFVMVVLLDALRPESALLALPRPRQQIVISGQHSANYKFHTIVDRQLRFVSRRCCRGWQSQIIIQRKPK